VTGEDFDLLTGGSLRCLPRWVGLGSGAAATGLASFPDVSNDMAGSARRHTAQVRAAG